MRVRTLLLLPLVLSALACGAEESPDEAPTAVRPIALVPGDLATADSGDVTTGVLLTGMLEPATSVMVAAQVPGTVGEILADRGTSVRAGQRLMVLVADGVRSSAEGARANVAAAEANATVARTRRDAARRLHEAGAIAKVELENAEAVFAAAEAQAAAARAQLAGAQESVGFTELVAPLTGTVSDRRVETGQAVRVGDALFTVVSTSTLELAGRVPVDAAGAIRVGQEVRFSIDAIPGRTFTGRVDRKDPVADAGTRQVGVYVRLANPQGAITAGQYARGEVTGTTVRNAVRIPESAVVGDGAEAHVFVLADGKLSRRLVVVVARSARDGVVAVSSGVTAGERVLARPAMGTADGQPAVVSEER